jgi:hypothetical protein
MQEEEKLPLLVLERFAYTDMGTFGRMNVAGITLYTVERPWLDNKPSVSCIPEGIYKCHPRWYNGGGYQAIEVADVPNRSHILFHIGNNMHDSAGCILVNSKLGSLEGIWSGLGSKAAFAHFMQHLNGRFALQIKQYQPFPSEFLETLRDNDDDTDESAK